VDLTALRVALTAALQTLSSDTYPLTCLPFVPAKPTPPAAFVAPTRATFDKAFRRGLDEWLFTVTLVVARGDDEASQTLLDAYLAGSGALSVKAAIEVHHPPAVVLGGACDDVHVTAVEAYRWFQFAEVQYLGAQWAVRVIGSGT
jgi:hypothetical protein